MVGSSTSRRLLAALPASFLFFGVVAVAGPPVSAAAPTATTTTAPSPAPTTSTTTPTTPPAVGVAGQLGGSISRPPLVGIVTQASEGGEHGVLLTTNRPLTQAGAPALPGCPDTVAETNLGAGCFYADAAGGTQWVQVLVLNRSDLSPATGVTPYNRDFDCPAATQYPNEATFDKTPGYGSACTKALSDFVGSLTSSDLVIAVSQPGSAATQPPVGVGAVLGGVGSNHGIGGSAKWYNAPDHGAHIDASRGTVSIIGVPGWKTGAVENESDTPHVADSGHLDANVAIDSSQLYSPIEEASAEIETDSPITKALDQPGTAWPGDSGELKAMAAIGTTPSVGLGANPRTQFYSLPSGNTAAYWKAEAAQVRLLKYADFPGLAEGDFDWAQKNLANEMDWVANVDTYTTALAMPYSDAQSTLWAYFNKIQDQINQDTQNGQTAETTATIFEALTSILEVAGGFGHAIHTISAAVVGAYHLILAFSDVGRAEDEPFSTEAANLAVELTTRLDNVGKEIQNQWRNIIVADYGKLRTVGTCSQRDTKCPNPADDNEAWQIDSDDEATMGEVIKMGLRRELYEKLVPAKYPEAMELNETTASNYDKNGGAGGWCPPARPFDYGTGGYLYAKDVQNGFVRPIVLVNNNGDHPVSQTVFNSMFNPVSKGGLAMNEQSFFEDNYQVNKPKNPPRWVLAKYWARYTLCGWINKG